MKQFNVNLCLAFAILLYTNQVSSLCLFPPEFEGEFIVQNAVVNSNAMQYSTINITADWIYPYGQCFTRNDSNVIVVLSPEDNSCFRCFNLQMVSKNIILLIHNEADINSKCSSSAETVKCPNEIALNDDQKVDNDFHSIILLYRTAERDGPRRNEFCPFDFFDGEIKFDYYVNDEMVCGGYESIMSQCPSSSSLNIRFKGCTSSQLSLNYECIGHWNALNKNYLAVIEWINGTVPRYKCGTYRYENEDKSEISLMINNDCSSISSKTGFSPISKNQQTFKIQKRIETFPNHELKASDAEFPSWMQGKWQFLDVSKGQLVYRDHSSFKSYRMSLVNKLNNEKFIVRSRSQCGEESFKCLWIRKLDENILEFQASSESTKKLTNFELCNESQYFDNGRWLTQSKLGKDVKKSCPISGKYFGRLPDDLELCSAMTSHCQSDVMHFQIGPCDTGEIYERRLYRCLGQWTDSKSSTVYTFTKRIDVVNTYECFVGLMAGSEKQIIIREAGENCFKMLDPQNYGMEMNKTEQCRDEGSLDEEIIVHPTKDDHSITYETVFDDQNNHINFNTATTTRKTKTTKKHKAHHEDENSVENEIAYEPTSSAGRMIYRCGLLLMICNLQNLIIVKDIL